MVSIANSLIGHNQDREPRQLTPWPANGTGTAHIVQYSSLAREVIGVADFVQDLIQNQNYQPQDILVLAQRRAIGNPINDALAARGIPSKSYYQEGLLDSEYAQERLTILKLFVNPQDRIALRWLLGTGSQNFRTGAYSRVRTYCEQNRLSPWAAMTQLSSGEIKIPYTAPLVERFKAIEAELKSLEGNESVLDFAEVWLQGVVEGFDPFRDLALDIAPLVLSPEELLESIVDQVSQPELPPDVTEVRIMSLHKSKGLSSPVVIIAGCVEGLLPAAPDPDLTPAENAAALEEQRRLFFVGLTRCKAKPEVRQGGILLLTSSREMNLADAMQSGIRPARVVFGTAIVQTSRFIRELGPAAPAPQRG